MEGSTEERPPVALVDGRGINARLLTVEMSVGRWVDFIRTVLQQLNNLFCCRGKRPVFSFFRLGLT